MPGDATPVLPAGAIGDEFRSTAKTSSSSSRKAWHTDTVP
jgi:hypothetical protein